MPPDTGGSPVNKTDKVPALSDRACRLEEEPGTGEGNPDIGI